MKRKRERRSYNVTPEDFIRAWETSDTAQDVADKLNMPKDIVLARASAYKGQGVQLKKLRRVSRGGLDVGALNRLVEQLRQGKTEGDLEEPEGVRPRKRVFA